MADSDEIERLRQHALDRLQVVDSPEERAYDDITRLAADVCGTPMALISLSDHERQWFKSRVGLQVQELPRENSFCSHVLRTPQEVMVIEDTAKDDRFAKHPLVTGSPHIRFYAGAPLLTSDGFSMGAICVVDTVPRQLDANQLQTLQFMAQQVMIMLESRLPPEARPANAPN
ncbi:MAG: GAF domain-containing protein [Polaromonas sp.]|nr:GAF domain-containing protein [Polaromonas sp.]